MKARIKWTEGMSFVAESGSGHAVYVDGAPEHGGRNLAMRPMEMVLAGAAACTAFDVVLILKRARQPVTDCVVEAEADRAAVEPKVFTRIRLAYTIAGHGLDYLNVRSIAALRDIEAIQVGHAIVSRAVFVGLAVLLVLPIVWGFLRRGQGLPMFGSPTIAELEDPDYVPGLVGMKKVDRG